MKKPKIVNNIMNQTQSIKVAVVGTGFGEKIHIPGFKEHLETEVIAIYHRDPDKAKAIAKTHDIPYAFSSLDDLLSLESLHGVSIATPPFLHYDMAKQVLMAGKHLLLEKPMTIKTAQIRDLHNLAVQNNLIAIPNFEFRFIPAWQLLCEYLQQGYVGKKYLIKIDWLVPSRANPERPWNWYSRADLGGGVLGAIGSHCFDYINWLFGPVKRLCSYLNSAIPLRPDPLSNNELKPVDSDDTTLIMLELADGTPCQIALSSVANNGRGHWLEIYGDRGTLVLGSSNLKDYVHGFHLKAASTNQTLTEVEIPKRLNFPQLYSDGRLAPFIRVVDTWVQGIKQDQPTTPSLQEGVYSQLLMDLAQQSHQQNAWIDVP
jgi:predicted dehydrogenase